MPEEDHTSVVCGEACLLHDSLLADPGDAASTYGGDNTSSAASGLVHGAASSSSGPDHVIGDVPFAMAPPIFLPELRPPVEAQPSSPVPSVVSSVPSTGSLGDARAKPRYVIQMVGGQLSYYTRVQKIEVLCLNPLHIGCKLTKMHGPPGKKTSPLGDGRSVGLVCAWAANGLRPDCLTKEQHQFDPRFWPTLEERREARQTFSLISATLVPREL